MVQILGNLSTSPKTSVIQKFPAHMLQRMFYPESFDFNYRWQFLRGASHHRQEGGLKEPLVILIGCIPELVFSLERQEGGRKEVLG